MSMVIGESISRDYLASLVRQIMALPREKLLSTFDPMSLEPEECDLLDYIIEHQSYLAREISEALQLPPVVVRARLESLRSRGYVGTSEPAYKGWARPWYITDNGKRAAVTPQRWAVS